MLWWRFYYEICSCSLIATEAIELAGEHYRGTTMINRLLLVLLASFLLANFAQAKEPIDLKDGKVHDVNKIPDNSCAYRLDYLYKGDPTTLNFTSKEQNLAFISAYQESIVNLSNANCYSVTGYDNSTINVSESETSMLGAYGSSVLTLANTANYNVSVQDNAKINIKDGRIVSFHTQSNNPVTITSGRFGFLSASNKGQIIIVGSDFRLDGAPTKLTKITLDIAKRDEEHSLSFTLENKYMVAVKISLRDKGSIILEQIKDKTEVKPK